MASYGLYMFGPVPIIIIIINLIIIIIGVMVRVFANDPEVLGSIPSRVLPKTQKIVLYASLHNTQQYKIWIKGKVEQPRERSSAFLCTVV